MLQKEHAHKLDSGTQRRALIRGSLTALHASSLLAGPRRVAAQQNDQRPIDPLILLLKGIYQPVHAGGEPNLGLSTANLSDGSYAVTKIYPVYGIGNSGGATDQNNTIESFYVSSGMGFALTNLRTARHIRQGCAAAWLQYVQR